MIKLLKSESGNIQMVQSAIYLIVLLVVLYIGLTINQNVIEATDLDAAVASTGTVTFTGVGVADETINISSETYTMKAAPSAAFEVGIGSNVTLSMDNLTVEIQANSTVVSATNLAGVGTITAETAGVAGNAYILTTDVTGASVSGATLAGGSDADALYTAGQDMDGVTESAYGMAGIMPIVMIAVAILVSLIGIVYLFR